MRLEKEKAAGEAVAGEGRIEELEDDAMIESTPSGVTPGVATASGSAPPEVAAAAQPTRNDTLSQAEKIV